MDPNQNDNPHIIPIVISHTFRHAINTLPSTPTTTIRPSSSKSGRPKPPILLLPPLANAYPTNWKPLPKKITTWTSRASTRKSCAIAIYLKMLSSTSLKYIRMATAFSSLESLKKAKLSAWSPLNLSKNCTSASRVSTPKPRSTLQLSFREQSEKSRSGCMTQALTNSTGSSKTKPMCFRLKEFPG